MKGLSRTWSVTGEAEVRWRPGFLKFENAFEKERSEQNEGRDDAVQDKVWLRRQMGKPGYGCGHLTKELGHGEVD